MTTQTVARPRRRARQRRRVNWGRLCAFGVIVWALIALGSVEWQILQGRRNLADLERLMAVEQARAESLAAEISYRNSNEYIELVARRELGLVKPGEVSVMLGVNR